MMGAPLVPLGGGEMVPDRERRFVSHLPATRETTQRKIRFFVSVKKEIGITAKRAEYRAAEGRAGVGVAGNKM
jgi:hypothetical protein